MDVYQLESNMAGAIKSAEHIVGHDQAAARLGLERGVLVGGSLTEVPSPGRGVGLGDTGFHRFLRTQPSTPLPPGLPRPRIVWDTSTVARPTEVSQELRARGHYWARHVLEAPAPGLPSHRAKAPLSQPRPFPGP